MSPPPRPYLSIVVPAYKQGKTIKRNLNHIIQVLDTTRYTYEIICVIDGHVDNTLSEIKEVKSSRIKRISYEKNQGKGYAVKEGMSSATGDIVGFLDAGLELDPKGLLMGLEHLNWYSADIIVGSKRHPVSIVNYPQSRRVISFGYQILVRILFNLKIRDTQVGLKLFRRKVLHKILPKLLVKEYAFDIEMLALAQYFGFKKIYESPVEIHYDFKDLTHASTFKSIFHMLWDTLAVFYRLRIMHYYDDSNEIWKK